VSLELVEAQIRAFLKADTPEILAITGAWGVGKTFIWNSILLSAKKQNRIALEEYSYVSLFGISSIDELKLSIFMQTGPTKDIGSEDDSSSANFIERIIANMRGRKSVPHLKNLPYLKNFWSVIQTASFLSLTKTIICLDDFERMGEKLSAKDVLGLVNFLKEQNQCKIALVFNEEKLRDDALADLRDFREKVIDIQLVFAPTASECTKIALSDDEISLKLKEYVERLGINNIRVIKKIERLARIIVSHLGLLEKEVTNQALKSLTLFAWSRFSGPGLAPDYEFIKKTKYDFKLLWSNDEDKNTEENEQNQKWSAILLGYDFYACSEFDLQVADIVERGYVDKTTFVVEAQKLNEQIKLSGSTYSFNEAMEFVYQSFDDNEEEVVKKLSESVRNNIKYLRPLDLDAAVRILRKLEKDALADTLIAEYVNTRADEPQLFSLRASRILAANLTDQKLITAFSNADESQKQKRRMTLRGVLDKIVEKNGWDPDDELFLSKVTSDQYESLFKEERSSKLADYIAVCLSFGQFVNAPPEYKAIASNAVTALKKIGKQNRLNALRIESLGVTPETPK
jgi:hypothetical protein